MRKIFICFFAVMILIIGLAVVVNGELTSFDGRASTVGRFASNYQYQPSFQTYYGGRVAEYWPILGGGEQQQCEARQDLLIQVAPAGCQPAVVRSDLLEEQDVPVFCQLDAFKLNPLIDISEINHIGFGTKYPTEVKGVGFHPARAALRTQDKLLGSPLISNIGYAVVILKRQPNESSMSSFVYVNLSARVEYDSGNALGIGKTEFLLTPSDSLDAIEERIKQSFWQGRYSVELERADPEIAVVSIYRGDVKVATGRAELGRLSSPIYLPGSYCRAGLQVAYDGFTAALPKARLEIGDVYGLDVIDVYAGSRILDGRCSITSLELYKEDTSKQKGENKKVEVTKSREDNVAIGKVSINCGYDNEIELELTKRELGSLGTPAVPTTAPTTNDLTDAKKEAFKEAIKYYEDVSDKYRAERIKDLPEGAASTIVDLTYGEQALAAAIDLASQYTGGGVEEERLINKMLALYPKTNRVKYYKDRLEEIIVYDTSKASGVVYLGGKYRTIKLVKLEDPIFTSSASVYIDDRPAEKLVLKEERELQDKAKEKVGRIIVDNLERDKMSLSFYCQKKDKDGKSIEGSRESVELRRGEGAKDVCNSRIRLDKVDIKEVVKIRLVPFVAGTSSNVNFTIGIGIEKRAIKLNPDKAKEKIENLNNSIKKMEGIVNTLGKVVSTMKGVCFATAGIMTAKTFLTGLKGEGIARQQVMKGESGWTEQCKKMIDAGIKGYKTLDECFIKEADNINKDVKAEAGAIQKVNEKIRSVEDPYKTKGGLFGESSVDTQKAAKDYAKYLRATYGAEKVGGSTVNALISEDCYEKSECDYTTLRNIEQAILSKKAGVSEGTAKNLDSSLKEYETIIKNNKERLENEVDEQKLRKLGLGASTSLSPKGRYNIVGDVKSAEKVDRIIVDKLRVKNAKEDIKNVVVFDVPADSKSGFSGGTYVAGLETVSGGDRYQVVSLAKVDKSGQIGEGFGEDKVKEFSTAYGVGPITSKESVSYNNRYKNPEVRYYDNAPYKGLPALVPIDVNEGWYAGTKQTLPAFGGIAGFESSGRVNSFWLCNVGKNGREQFQESGFGDDVCQLVNLDTGQPLGAFPGIEEAKAKELVGKAVRALTDAANQYGNKPVVILGRTYTNVKSAPNVPAVQCQDFMDPKDCNLMFNACDPVICPASRCNFGGMYQVSDVIQSGIIGSTLLCLPNIREKIAIPICLTGIHAGLDSYVSILKSHRDCLQESIATGQNVGICDQITSIYLCEFFWRQGAPLAKILLPKLLEMALGGGQSARGGGEYMTVSAAWNNAQKSLNFFTDYYAVNALKAYRIRSVEEAGTPICKAFISAQIPTKFKSLVEPDSPPQFYSWFSAIKYSDATVPATSQYKVFYHIFAGKDSGVYYRVYLKNPPETGYYYASPIIQVASSFIPKGEYKTETRDFIAPEGYQELCVDINGEEKCGFKQVSTDAAINYIRDQTVKNEVDKAGIKSEKECISGSPSLSGAAGAALTNTNPQAAVEEAVIPEIYSRGIIRICSTQNPGSATTPMRYQDVGYCGEEAIRCWLDKQSVNTAITAGDNLTLQEIEQRQKEIAKSQVITLGDDGVNANLRTIKSKVENLEKQVSDGKLDVNTAITETKKVEENIDNLFGKDNENLVQNHHKAEVLLRKAQLKGVVALAYLKSKVKVTIATATASPPVMSATAQGVILKGSAADYKVGNKYYFTINGEDTKIYIEGTKVGLESTTLSNIGTVSDNKVTLLPSYYALLSEYFDLIDGTEIKQVNSGEDYRLVKTASSGSSPATAAPTTPTTSTAAPSASGIIVLKDSLSGHNPIKKTYLIIDGVETKVYLFGAGVFVDGTAEKIGDIKDLSINLLSEKKTVISAYFDVINGTKITMIKEGENWQLVKVKEVPSSGSGREIII